MKRKYMSWDIETHKILPEDFGNIMDHRPLGITCISLLATGNDKPALFYAGQENDEPVPRKMNVDELTTFFEELWAGFISGYTSLAWNGNFDFQILIEELGGQYQDDIKQIVRRSVDPMFQLFCKKGHPLGLETAAKGMNVKGKTEGMSGALAPEMWQGSLEDREKVLEYVGQDAVVPLMVVEEIEKHGAIRWTSRSGRPQYLTMKPLLTVEEAIKLPEPDTSWMSNPIPRSNFYGWAFD